MKFLYKKLYALIFWRTSLGEIISKIYDIKQHLKYSFLNNKLSDKENLYFYLTKQYHIIEKGLALPSPRPGFAQPKILDLIEKAQSYEKKYGQCQLTDSIKSCINKYIEFNKKIGAALPDNFEKKIQEYSKKIENINSGGSKKITKEEISSSINIDFKNFIKNRYSIRDYSNEKVNIEKIIEAIDLAKYTPSVCNRQSWNAHLYSDRKILDSILEIQNGNGGFGQCIDKILIITGNIKAFTKYESNQIFIDGGLFSMNVMLALHSKGLGTCPLNTSVPYLIENKIKKIANIPNNERLIMIIAIGNLKDTFQVAISKRRSTESILKIH